EKIPKRGSVPALQTGDAAGTPLDDAAPRRYQRRSTNLTSRPISAPTDRGRATASTAATCPRRGAGARPERSLPMDHAEDRSFWAGRPVALTGATGFLGHHLASRLLEVGADVRALMRSPARAARLYRSGASCVLGSLDDPASLRRAFAGCDVV